MYPLAVLPGQSTFTLSFTSAKFDTDMFAMTNGIGNLNSSSSEHAWNTNSSYKMSTGEHLEPNTNHEVILAYTPIADSVYIAGMEETTEQTIASGKYKVDAETKKITFSSDDVISYVDVVYDYTKEVTEAIVTNKESAIGEAVNYASRIAA